MLSKQSKDMCHQFCWVLEDDSDDDDDDDDDDGNAPDVDGNREKMMIRRRQKI